MYWKIQAERHTQEVLKMNDIDFILNIIAEIVNYARKNDYDIDDTIERMAQNLHDFLLIATFENWGDENEIHKQQP